MTLEVDEGENVLRRVKRGDMSRENVRIPMGQQWKSEGLGIPRQKWRNVDSKNLSKLGSNWDKVPVANDGMLPNSASTRFTPRLKKRKREIYTMRIMTYISASMSRSLLSTSTTTLIVHCLGLLWLAGAQHRIIVHSWQVFNVSMLYTCIELICHLNPSTPVVHRHSVVRRTLTASCVLFEGNRTVLWKYEVCTLVIITL